LVVLLPLLAASLCFGFTPYMATRDVPAPEVHARRLYAAGMLFLVCALVAAVCIAYVT
jgi:type VI protein secretion system component VasK